MKWECLVFAFTQMTATFFKPDVGPIWPTKKKKREIFIFRYCNLTKGGIPAGRAGPQATVYVTKQSRSLKRGPEPFLSLTLQAEKHKRGH